MFVSYFPNPPRLFFWSAVVWSALCVAGWYLGGEGLGAAFGLGGPADGQLPVMRHQVEMGRIENQLRVPPPLAIVEVDHGVGGQGLHERERRLLPA